MYLFLMDLEVFFIQGNNFRDRVEGLSLKTYK